MVRFRKPALMLVIFMLAVNVGFVLAAWDKNPVARVDVAMEGYFNANETGIGNLLRNLDGQKVHSNFLENTNSCASCHMTHVAPGTKLLLQRSVYNTCTTCHFNETMGTYNVLTGNGPNGANAGGRFFDGEYLTDSERPGASYHLATGLLQHWQAPGSGILDAASLPAESSWLKPFSCGSCHAPHGSYSERHLHYNPNRIADRFIKRPLVYNATDEVYLLGASERHLVPWLYYDRDDNPDLAVYIYKGSTDITSQFSINYATGEIRRVSGTDVPDSVTFSQAFVFGMNTDGTHKSGVVEFCTSCHLQFADQSGNMLHGDWSNSARPEGSKVVPFNHKIGMDVPQGEMSANLFGALALERDGTENRLTCLTCHFAHGTDLVRMQRRSQDGGLEPLQVSDPGVLPAYTANLRYLNPDNGDGYGGRFEACRLCHGGEFLYEPQVTATLPVNGSTVAAATVTTIDVEFDIALVNDVVATAHFSVEDNTLAVVAGTLALSGDRKLVFTPDVSLTAGMEYTVKLGNITSAAGGTLDTSQFKFFTFLEVAVDGQGNLQVQPQGTDVPSTNTIEALLTAGVEPTSVSEATFVVSYLLSDVKTQINGTYSVVGGKTILFTPTEPLPLGQVITVEVFPPAGLAPGILAESGAVLKEKYQWSFTVSDTM